MDFGRVALCSVLSGQDCHTQGCPQGQRCETLTNPSVHPTHVWRKRLDDKWVCAPAGGPTVMQTYKPEPL